MNPRFFWMNPTLVFDVFFKNHTKMYSFSKSTFFVASLCLAAFLLICFSIGNNKQRLAVHEKKDHPVVQTFANISGNFGGMTSVVFDPVPSALANVVASISGSGLLAPTRLVAAVDGVAVLYNATLRAGTQPVDGFMVGFGAGNRFLNVDGNTIATSATYVALRETTAIQRIYAAEDTLARTLKGNSAENTIIGGLGRDTISGGLGDDSLEGRSGNDSMFGGSGRDRLYGGDGNDSLYGHAGGGTLAETFENTLDGGNGNDLLVGSSGSDALYGGSGHDTMLGGGGNDTIIAWSGNDVIEAGEGHDRVVTEYGTVANLIIRMGGGNDTLDASGGGQTTQTVYGDTGNDTIDVVAMSSVVYGGTGNDSIIERSNGTSTDRLIGDADRDFILSSSGADSLYGGTGHDWLIVEHYETETQETVRVWAGADNDTVLIAAGHEDTSVVVSLEAGNDVLWVESEGEHASVVAYGGTGNDALLAMGLGDVLHGGDGNDVLWDRGAETQLYGGGGADVLFLQQETNPSQDPVRAAGGLGADIFVVEGWGNSYGTDVITDFNTEQGDRLLGEVSGPDVLSQIQVSRTSEGTMIRLVNQSPDDPSGVFLEGFQGAVTAAMFAAYDSLDNPNMGWNLDPSTQPPDIWAL